MLRACGRTLASLHRASATFPAGAARPDWSEVVRGRLAALAPGDTGVAAILAAGLSAPAGDRRLLHGDLELDNLRCRVGRGGVPDFDGAVYGPYILDVAIALLDVLRGPERLREVRVARFLDGYSEVWHPPGAAGLPELARLVMAVKVAGMLPAYAGVEIAGARSWLAEMHARHMRWLAARRAELVGSEPGNGRTSLTS